MLHNLSYIDDVVLRNILEKDHKSGYLSIGQQGKG